MIDIHVLAKLPVQDWYPAYQPIAQNATHWAGMIRLQDNEPNPVPSEWVLASIETNGENTYDAMLAGLDADTLARFRDVRPAEVKQIGDDGKAATVPTGPIVTMAWQGP